MMKHRILFVLAAATLAFTACGSDDDGGSDDGGTDTTVEADTDTTVATVATDATDDSGDSDGGDATGAQAEAADRTIEAAAAGGITLDEECVNEVASRLSDEDAAAIAAGNNADVSPEGSELSLELLNCADEDQLADMFIDGLSQSGQEFDEECVREKLKDVDMVELVQATQTGGQPPTEVVAAMMECVDLGS